jgi:hypothetical protein
VFVHADDDDDPMNLVFQGSKAAHFISEKFQGRVGAVCVCACVLCLFLAWYFITIQFASRLPTTELCFFFTELGAYGTFGVDSWFCFVTSYDMYYYIESVRENVVCLLF